ncbi:MAG TPA: YjjG family noncanonical pyrimidine nucleotidase [Paludibacteraceae bacterium]|nr:YjjG family noncanonical pyrimidine nucleotidase [Paludibacteraceae bacterium]HQB69170.1 YjjG family noncanonical pyrimidine nucleotidase [Paludibacteraceae bacterium]
MAHYTHLFFDLDDTLWDFRSNGHEALVDLFEKHQLERYFCSFDNFYHLYEPKNLELWALYETGEISKLFLTLERFSYPLRMVGVNNNSFARLLNDDYLAIMATKTKLIPHAQEVLDELRAQHYHLTIVSNGFCDVQYDKLRNSGLIHYFDTIVLSEEVGVQKPDPRFFQYALEKSGAKASDVLLVGDNYEVDIVGAYQCGIDALHFNRNGSLMDKKSQTIINLKEIFAFL